MAEKTDRLQLRINPELKAAIEKAAAADNRSITSWIECAVKAALTKSKENKIMTHQEFEAYVMLMDDDLREQVHAELAPCTDEEFLTRYQELHLAKYGEELEV